MINQRVKEDRFTTPAPTPSTLLIPPMLDHELTFDRLCQQIISYPSIITTSHCLLNKGYSNKIKNTGATQSLATVSFQLIGFKVTVYPIVSTIYSLTNK